MEQMSFELLVTKQPQNQIVLEPKERQELLALLSNAIIAVYRATKEQSDEQHDK